jgi:hypothetical protein
MSNQKAVVHSNAFIDMLEAVLGIKLNECHKVVITADVNEPLVIDLYIGLYGSWGVVNGFKEFAKEHVNDETVINFHKPNDTID